MATQSIERRLRALEQRIPARRDDDITEIHIVGLTADGQEIEDEPPLVLRIEPPHIQRQRRD
jgi:hypothetical protein